MSVIGILRQLSRHDERTVRYNVDLAAVLFCKICRGFSSTCYGSFLALPLCRAQQLFHKRAPMKAVCGRVTNAAGESLTKVDLTLTGETGAVLFTASSENEAHVEDTVAQALSPITKV